MTYTFVCNKCKNKVTIEQCINDPVPRNIPCSKCDGIMNQDFLGKGIDTDIPCTFDSYGQFAPKDFGSSDLEGYMDYLDGREV